MTEDILEQLVDGWFSRKNSTFTKHNVKYRPDITEMNTADKKKYSVHSDIDVLAINTNNEVSVVSCKSWQGGFDVDWWYDKLSDPKKHKKISSGREVWKSFRELTNDIWAKAFRDKIFNETNKRSFTYYIAVTKLKNDSNADKFINCNSFLNKLRSSDNDIVNIKFLTLENLISDIIDDMEGTALESSEIGRFIQLLKAANMTIKKIK